ncbi:Elongation of very long chain fatty acids protein AAEL008004 [Eumeta japonica]|uniref:Elongation of very long chain fatty acids protein n=1 Tax=Eumeta variegata TaxID=151549 RepID=A0A4C1UI36_EUMVA|nr:Elongation of very long chain fatty acids protein AAEL008004 [Eumeta japonica]
MYVYVFVSLFHRGISPAGGHSTFFGLLNTFVHIVMYSYYFLAGMGPAVQKYLWWKKYLTVLQMVQFVLVFLHAFQLLFIECDYPRAFVWWIGMHAVLFYYLFSDFYKQAYIKKTRLANAKAHVEAEETEKEMKLPLLNGFSNGAALNDVRQRVAGAVAAQAPIDGLGSLQFRSSRAARAAASQWRHSVDTRDEDQERHDNEMLYFRPLEVRRCMWRASLIANSCL